MIACDWVYLYLPLSIIIHLRWDDRESKRKSQKTTNLILLIVFSYVLSLLSHEHGLTDIWHFMPLRHHVFLHLNELPVLYKVKCTIGNNKTRQVPALRFRYRKVSGLQESSLHQCKLSVKKNLFWVSISTELKFITLIMFMMMPRSSPI